MGANQPWRTEVIARLMVEAVNDGEKERGGITDYVRERFPLGVTDDEMDAAAEYLKIVLSEREARTA